MRKKTVLFLLGLIMIASTSHAMQDQGMTDLDRSATSKAASSDDSVNITRISLSPASSPQANVPLTVTVNASCPSGKTIYYKYYYCGNYGTASYATTPWTVVKEYSTENTAQYTFQQAGNYIIVVRAVVDTNNEPVALPIIGQAVSVSDTALTNITGFSYNSSSPKAGDEVTFTAEATNPSGTPVFYKFYYCANYGTSAYDTTPWTVVQDYSLTGISKYVFPSAGNYVVVARAVADIRNEPAALPIVGTTVSVSANGDQSSLNMNDGKWEITTTMQGVPGMPPITNTSTQCLTKSNSVPDSGSQNCTASTPVVSGNTVTWSAVCQSSDCGQTTYNGSITYSGDSFTGSMTISGNCGNYTVQMSGRKIGACD